MEGPNLSEPTDDRTHLLKLASGLDLLQDNKISIKICDKTGTSSIELSKTLAAIENKLNKNYIS